ncbi:MAG: hypothetical protein EOM40_04425 [Clostridia bacterium]|nr:hypothetical protein [Clostridia bacterium]NCC42036.1 hypothetical protein [Clostridia bacterium]
MKKKRIQVMAWMLAATMFCSQNVAAAVPTEETGIVESNVQNTQSENPSVTVTDSNATDPTVTDAATTDPTATDSNATDPTVTDAATTDPTVTDPTTTDPTATDPAATNKKADVTANQQGTLQGSQANASVGSDIQVMSETEPVIGDTVVEQNITYAISKVAVNTTHGQVTVKDGKTASGSVVIPKTITIADRTYDVLSIDNYAFQDNTELESIDFSATAIKSIGNMSFSGCTKLSAVLPTQGIVYLAINQNAFKDCTSLKEISFNYVQILKSAFMGSAIEKITIMKPIGLRSNAFSAMKDGFKLVCPNELGTSAIDASVFGTTKNVTLVVPNETTKTAMETKFGTKITVELMHEEEGDVLLTSADGTITPCKDLQAAFEAINNSDANATFELTIRNGVSSIVWPEGIMPARETTVDFGGCGNVTLPTNMTLQAPLTIQNVTNFSSETLCNLTAGDHAFQMIKGGSYGFASISGNNLSFSDRLPGSAALTAACKITGTGTNPQIAFHNIGSSNYIYGLPDMENFTDLVLEDSFMNVEAGTSLKNISMTDSGMTVQGDMVIDTLQGSGNVSFGEESSLTVTASAEGNFKLAQINGKTDDVPVQMPKNSSAALTDKDGNPILMVATVSGGNLNGQSYASLREAANAITKDGGAASTTYTISLNADAELVENVTLADAKLIINGNGKTLSAAAGVTEIRVPGNCLWQNINFALEGINIHYTPNTDRSRVIELASTVTGKLGGLLDDSGFHYLDFKIGGTGIEVGKVTGTKDYTGTCVTDLFLEGYGTAENPVSLKGKVENIGGLSLSNCYITAAGDCSYLGTVRTPRRTTKGKLIITDDTALHTMSLSTGTAFDIEIPGDKTLTLDDTTPISSSKIPLTITGEVKDGQVVVQVDRSRPADMFFLKEAPEDTILQYNDENYTYVLHKHNYEYKSDETTHWTECSCGLKGEAEAHIGGTANCKDPAVCETCGAFYGEVDPENHTGETEIRGRVEATTLKEGYTGDTYCLGCGEKLKEGSVIAKKEIEAPEGKWLKNNTGWWYQNKDGSWPANEWQEIEGSWYHFNSRGYMQTGWLQIGGKWYYLNQSGSMQIGWQKISGKWYYFSNSYSDGSMKTGWQKIGTNWYYLSGSSNDGAMKVGWQMIGGNWYYLSGSSNDGAMKIGWQLIGGNWYYLSSSYSDGSMKTDWQQIDGKWYYMDKKSGIMARNQWVGKYHVNASGVWDDSRK